MLQSWYKEKFEYLFPVGCTSRDMDLISDHLSHVLSGSRIGFRDFFIKPTLFCAGITVPLFPEPDDGECHKRQWL